MARLVWFVAVASVVSAPLARAEPTGTSPRGQLWLFLSPEEHFCAGPPLSWHDPSDPVFFATGPTARLDQHELWAGGLSPLAAVRYEDGELRLLILGTPAPPHFAFSPSGSRSRWPFC